MDDIMLGFDFYIMAMSLAVQHKAEGNGNWDALIATGAHVLLMEYRLCLGLETHFVTTTKCGVTS